MSKHLFGLVLTHHGTAANNRGETEGNITTLQKILWKGEVHTTVSAEAIRFAVRWLWQRSGEHKVNRLWNDELGRHKWQDAEFQKWKNYMDDDVLGFMSARAAKEEGGEGDSGQQKGKQTRARGSIDKRRGRLEVTRAVSLTPFEGDITFNAASPGATPSASSTGRDPVPYGTELHATRYQYGFALTPEDLADKVRALAVIDAVAQLSGVAGNHNRFLYDFSPESVVFRWTDDFAPRILYGFDADASGLICIPDIVSRVEAGDIDASELLIGGKIVSDLVAGSVKETLLSKGAFLHEGIKNVCEEAKKWMRRDLGLGDGKCAREG